MKCKRSSLRSQCWMRLFFVIFKHCGYVFFFFYLSFFPPQHNIIIIHGPIQQSWQLLVLDVFTNVTSYFLTESKYILAFPLFCTYSWFVLYGRPNQSSLRLKLCMWLLPMGAGDIGYVRPASAASEAVSWFGLFGVSNNPLLLGQNWKITPFYWVKILNSPRFIESIFCKCSLLCSKTFLSFRTLHIAYPILVGTPCKYFMEIK